MQDRFKIDLRYFDLLFRYQAGHRAHKILHYAPITHSIKLAKEHLIKVFRTILYITSVAYHQTFWLGIKMNLKSSDKI